MPEVTIDQAVQVAIGCQQTGRLGEAEAIYQQILAVIPQHADSLHMLGTIASQTGRTELAVELIRQAIAASPENAEYHYNLGYILQSQGEAEQAIACYQKALEIKPALAEARFNLANALKKKGELECAIAEYRHALEIKPDHAGAANNLGNALNDLGRGDEAIACYRQALGIRAEYPEAQVNLATALREKGEFVEAIGWYRRAIELKPGQAEAHHHLGVALWKHGQLSEAIIHYLRATEINPDYAEAHYSLGIALRDNNQREEAIACYQRALRIKPRYSEARNNLAGVLWEMGQLDAAIACYRTAVELDPAFVSAHDNLLYALNFHPASTRRTLFEESQRWRRQHADVFAKWGSSQGAGRARDDIRDADRRLRIGYVSPDFRRHPVGRSLLPVMLNHDPDAFEVVCYSSTLKADAMTERFKSGCAVWRDVTLLSDEQLARQITEDRIDILIDLTLHMSGSRLLVFARKPAPVQITWLGYPGTTGLATMDYRISDPHMDPPGQNDAFYSEKTIRLPHTFQVYDPLPGELPVNSSPAIEAGHVTLGCLNNFAKVNEPLLHTWARILQASPSARLLLKSSTSAATQWAGDILASHGIAPNRVEFPADLATHEIYMLHYHRIDLALDPFPYNGHTTSMDAIWMGVPVLSRHGETAVSRAGLSQSANLGLPELAVDSEAEYIRAATELIADIPRLAELRRTLRDRMKASPLMDARGFTRALENALRAAWREWRGE